MNRVPASQAEFVRSIIESLARAFAAAVQTASELSGKTVFPFAKFPGVDPILGPEMKSTGEVMGVGDTFGEAFAKAQMGASEVLPTGGTAFISVRDDDKPLVAGVARDLINLGFEVVATAGTAKLIEAAGLKVDRKSVV